MRNERRTRSLEACTRVPLPALLRTAPQRAAADARRGDGERGEPRASPARCRCWPACARGGGAAPQRGVGRGRGGGVLHHDGAGVPGTRPFTTRCRTAARQAVARAVDHAAIYLFIAGSATPFTLGAMTGWSGWAGIATGRVAVAAGAGRRHSSLMRRLTQRRLSTGLYLLLGWCAALAAPGVAALTPPRRFVAGRRRGSTSSARPASFRHPLRFGHFIWHLFVMAGSGCHLAAALA